MENRKALIFGYPGEYNTENYCEGVFHDIENYKKYLLSNHGGAWIESDEVHTEISISRERLSAYINYFDRKADYSLIVFAGHGEYNLGKKQTCLQLNREESILVSDLYNGNKRQLLIIDCCRKISKILIESRIQDSAIYKSFSNNSDAYREKFDQMLKASVEDKIEVYSCDIDEYSRDISNKGGLFSYNLLDEAKGNEDLTIYKTFEKAKPHVIETSRNMQNPVIQRPRTGNSFPFYLS
jgi:hypothetical protein